jgi:hypothetical protein
MQLALAASPAAACSKPQRRQQQGQRRRRGDAQVARADVGFCRDKISDRKDLTGEIEGTAKVVFLGADGAEVEVECPKVRLGPLCGSQRAGWSASQAQEHAGYEPFS